MKAQLTAATAKKITMDWSLEFPSMAIYKPMRLLRNCGPIVVGLCLNRTGSGSAYRPTSHYHCLLTEFPAVSLSMPLQPKLPNGADDDVSIRQHDLRFRAVAEGMKLSPLLPWGGDVNISQYDSAVRRWLSLQPSPCWPKLHEDRVLIYAWLGMDFRAPLREAEVEIKKWPEYVLAKIGGVADWIRRVDALASDRNSLHSTLSSETEKLKLSKLPVSDLLS